MDAIWINGKEMDLRNHPKSAHGKPEKTTSVDIPKATQAAAPANGLMCLESDHAHNPQKSPKYPAKSKRHGKDKSSERCAALNVTTIQYRMPTEAAVPEHHPHRNTSFDEDCRAYRARGINATQAQAGYQIKRGEGERVEKSGEKREDDGPVY